MFVLIKSRIDQALLPTKLMQIMQYDLENAMFQKQILCLLTDRNFFVDFHTKP